VDDSLAAVKSFRDSEESLSVQLQDETAGILGSVFRGEKVHSFVNFGDNVSLVESSGVGAFNVRDVPFSGDVDVDDGSGVGGGSSLGSLGGVSAEGAWKCCHCVGNSCGGWRRRGDDTGLSDGSGEGLCRGVRCGRCDDR